MHGVVVLKTFFHQLKHIFRSPSRHHICLVAFFEFVVATRSLIFCFSLFRLQFEDFEGTF